MPRSGRFEFVLEYRDEQTDGGLDHRTTDRALAVWHKNTADFTRRGLDFIANAGIPDDQEIAAMSTAERTALHGRVTEQVKAEIATNDYSLSEAADIVTFAMDHAADGQGSAAWLLAYGEIAAGGENAEVLDFVFETAVSESPVDWNKMRQLEFNNPMTDFILAVAIADEAVQDARDAAAASLNPKAAAATVDAACHAIRRLCATPPGQAAFSERTEASVSCYRDFLQTGIAGNAGFLAGEYQAPEAPAVFYDSRELADYASRLEANLHAYQDVADAELGSTHFQESETATAVQYQNESVHLHAILSLVNDLKLNAFLHHENDRMMAEDDAELEFIATQIADPEDPYRANLRAQRNGNAERARMHRDNALAAIEFISYATAPRREQPTR